MKAKWRFNSGNVVRCCGILLACPQDTEHTVCIHCGRWYNGNGEVVFQELEETHDLPTEPGPEDLVTQDYRTWVWSDTGRVAIRTSPASWRSELRQWMHEEGYFPDCWEYLERDVYFLVDWEEE